MAHEEWRDVVGYEGLYQVSNLGRVRSLEHKARNGRGWRTYKGGIKSIIKDKISGFEYVKLFKNSVGKKFLVSRIVATAFIANDSNKSEVVHINGNLSDNSVDNLIWATTSERLDRRDKRNRYGKYSERNESITTPIVDIPNEVWRPVNGYEGFYEVSNLGRVKSVDRVIHTRNNRPHRVHERILSTEAMRNGYRSVTLCKNGVAKSVAIHRIVAMAFLEQDVKRRIVDHINGIKTDNRAENLRWVTDAENHQYAIELGLVDLETHSHRMKSSEFRQKANEANAKKAKAVMRSDGIRFNSISEAAKALNVSASSISNTVNGRTKSIKGYSFSFVGDEPVSIER